MAEINNVKMKKKYKKIKEWLSSLKRNKIKKKYDQQTLIQTKKNRRHKLMKLVMKRETLQQILQTPKIV